MKILANDGISAEGKQKLEEKGFTVVTENVPQENLVDTINSEGYDILLVRSATTARKALIDACPNLKFIGRGGVGMDNIDVEYARGKGLAVENTPGASSQSVAELVFAHLFSISRSLYDSNRQMPVIGKDNFKDLKKRYGKGIELRAKTLGIIGIGRIGQSVASYALGCGMKVITHDPHIDQVTIELKINGNANVQVGLSTISMDDLLKQSDFITLHVPKQADGSAVIGSAQFEQMKDDVCIVNSARGGVIDEQALIQALDSGKVLHAALDVFENEPNPSEELLNHRKISLTPHVGAATGEAQARIGLELADKIIKFAKSYATA
ncbi:MAG: D-2-hydroxyacid dehydrogenase [Flavobacteriales bacterium]|nr:D-2-hydroxyacid dehydrogenase [Flavobacteriales bacterium]